MEGKGYGGLLLLDVFEALKGHEFILADVVHKNKRSLKCLKRTAEATGRATTALGPIVNNDLVPGSEAADDDDLVEWCFANKGDKNKKGRDIWTAAKAAEDAKKRKTKRSQGITAPPPEPPSGRRSPRRRRARVGGVEGVMRPRSSGEDKTRDERKRG